MWAYRELIYFLIWRDVKVRYKQTLLGVAWSVLQPLMYALVFTIIFSRIAHAPSEGLPYLLFAFCGFVLWFLFSTAITQAGNSVVGSEALITKVYFPRLAIPFAAAGAALFDFAVTLLVLIPMVIYYLAAEGSVIAFTWQLALVPVIVFLTLLASLGVGAFLAALNVSFRDFKHTIPFLVQLWMLATPAIYFGIEHERLAQHVAPPSSPTAKARPAAPTIPTTLESPQASQPALQNTAEAPLPAAGTAAASHTTAAHQATKGHARPASGPEPPSEGAVPDWVQNLLKFNPMTGLVRAFRAAALGQPMPWNHLAYSTVTVLAVFFGGCLYFHRVEDRFADII
jgi:lipopolysaccharide transport system permease protein